MRETTTIFIADDDEDDRMFIREALQTVIPDVRIIECADAIELFENITNLDIRHGSSLILLDMNMPKIDGLEAISLIRSNEAISHIPVIMLSTGSHSEQIRAAYLHGINAYITKPSLVQGYIEIADTINTCFLNNDSFSEERAGMKGRRRADVLLIEDNIDEKTLMVLGLASASPNINVIGIHDEDSTLEYLTEKLMLPGSRPQLIVLDLYLPARQNGLNLLDQIKTLLVKTNRPAVPVIIVSHSSATDDITECYRQRANAYVVKSMDMGSWVHYFSRLCNFWMDTVSLPHVA